MQIAKRAAAPLAPFRAPMLSPTVERAVRLYLDHEAHGNLARFGVPVLPEDLRERAVRYLADADAEGQPASVQTVLAWLAPIAGAVAQAPPKDDFETRASAIAIACADIPGWAFNADTAREAVREFKFFPSAAEVRTLLLASTKPHRDTIRALRALSKPPEPVQDEGRTYPTGETREAMATVLRGLVREVETRARNAEETPLLRKVEPNHPAPAALAELRRAAGIIPKGDA